VQSLVELIDKSNNQTYNLEIIKTLEDYDLNEQNGVCISSIELFKIKSINSNGFLKELCSKQMEKNRNHVNKLKQAIDARLWSIFTDEEIDDKNVVWTNENQWMKEFLLSDNVTLRHPTGQTHPKSKIILNSFTQIKESLNLEISVIREKMSGKRYVHFIEVVKTKEFSYKRFRKAQSKIEELEKFNATYQSYVHNL
jgi:hypothetical protein